MLEAMSSLAVGVRELCAKTNDELLSSQHQAAERLRVQELLRYFHPNSSNSALKNKPRLAGDTSLTAYAQLSALKLNCQRSFISLMDHSNQYIIAEATRSISLNSEDIIDDENDAIYLGQTMLDLVWGVCPNTIKLFTSTDSSLNVHTTYVKATESYYVMNDLSALPEFKDRPYVAGWPHMRYYAEVPIHSPSGLTIGTLCVVDDKPREGLDIKGLRTLQEIADAVMDHLDLCTNRMQRKRAEGMIHGLGRFVAGFNNLQHQWHTTDASSEIPTTQFGSSQHGHIPRLPIVGSESEGFATVGTSGNDNLDSSDEDELRTLRGLTDLESMFLRASRLIQEALVLDGVVFFDTRSNNEPTAPARVIAQSNKSGASFPTSQPGLLDLPFAVLKGLLANSATGGIFNFDDDGLVSRQDLKFQPHFGNPSHKPALGSRSRRKEGDPTNDLSFEINKLMSVLPEVRSIIFYPMWDALHRRWFSFNLAWTNNPKHNFEPEDIAYLTSLGTSILSESSKLEIMAADRAKADFISSISHELRSPLHGILASVELLRDMNLKSTSEDIINTIESCGSILLDTMDNLLTFAKINNVPPEIRRNSASEEDGDLRKDANSLRIELDLRELVEKVTEACVAGHQLNKASEECVPSPAKDVTQSLKQSVTVICDIEDNSNWIFDTNAGAWKRIIVNLLGNALKYTSSGYILVKLRQEQQLVYSLDDTGSGSNLREQEDNLSTTNVILSIEDSGKGISLDYLMHHLFKPFCQENSLSPGTGLGLSIVKQLVTSINGQIDVSSKVGVGTTILITTCLEAPIRGNLSSNLSLDLVPLKGLTVGILGLEPGNDDETVCSDKDRQRQTILASALSKQLFQTFGVESVDAHSKELDITIIPESLYRRMETSNTRPPSAALIVLCETLTMDYRMMTNESEPVVFLSQPFGPRRLAKALTTCMPILRSRSHQRSPPQGVLPNSRDGKEQIEVIVPASEPSPPSTPKEDAGDEPSKTAEHPTLLLVEDNPINLKLLVTICLKHGWNFVTAVDGLQAVKAYLEAKGMFDVIFMDIQMPLLNGIEATTQIREYERLQGLRRTKVVALTGLASMQTSRDAKDSGVDMFLTKPTRTKRIHDIVIETLKERAGSAK